MSDPTGKKDDGVAAMANLDDVPDEEILEDEEKILAGRHDVNYPAMLTKDVPGG